MAILKTVIHQAVRLTIMAVVLQHQLAQYANRIRYTQWCALLVLLLHLFVMDFLQIGKFTRTYIHAQINTLIEPAYMWHDTNTDFNCLTQEKRKSLDGSYNELIKDFELIFL